MDLLPKSRVAEVDGGTDEDAGGPDAQTCPGFGSCNMGALSDLKASVLSFTLLRRSWGLLEAHGDTSLLPPLLGMSVDAPHPVCSSHHAPHPVCSSHHTPKPGLLSVGPAACRLRWEELSQVTVTLECDKPLAEGAAHS